MGFVVRGGSVIAESICICPARQYRQPIRLDQGRKRTDYMTRKCKSSRASIQSFNIGRDTARVRE